MGLGVGERQRRAPRAAEHQPLFDVRFGAQPLDVGDQIPGRVRLQRRERRRAAAAALIEQRDVVTFGIEQSTVIGRDSAAGSPCRNTAGAPPGRPLRS